MPWQRTHCPLIPIMDVAEGGGMLLFSPFSFNSSPSRQPGETRTPDVKELPPTSSELVADEPGNPEYKLEDVLIAKEGK